MTSLSELRYRQITDFIFNGVLMVKTLLKNRKSLQT